MSMSGELNEHTASLLDDLVEGAEAQYSTYGEAIKGLESEKARLARAELPRGANEIDRAIQHLTIAIYNEAAWQLNNKARELKIPEDK
ncbi:MAG: hypothetical protein DUD32_12665 [Lactobacillus sp.]|nr:MAG: hypothetical protein DUD32_12665 [Lactobacillus sp.]